MSQEQPGSKSEAFSFFEQFEAAEELGSMVGEFPILPLEIGGIIFGQALEGFVGE